MNVTVGKFRDWGVRFIEGDRLKLSSAEGEYALQEGESDLVNRGDLNYIDDLPVSFQWRTNEGVTPSFIGSIEISTPEGVIVILGSSSSDYDWSKKGRNGIDKWRPLLGQPMPQQDLTTLDVPFGELDRDTQLRLVNHVLDGGELVTQLEGGDYWGELKFITAFGFTLRYKYRAVAKQPEQPTERETLEAKLHEQWTELNATMKRITEIK